MVLGLPQVVALSYADNVAPSLDSLQARLGLSDDELRHLATRLPQLLGLSISANIEPKLSFLQQQLEFDEETLRHEVLRAPTVLGSSLADSLRPNAEMWQAVLRAEGLDLGAEIARRGLLFLCFSHQRRTKPRLERLLRAGLCPRASRCPRCSSPRPSGSSGAGTRGRDLLHLVARLSPLVLCLKCILLCAMNLIYFSIVHIHVSGLVKTAQHLVQTSAVHRTPRFAHSTVCTLFNFLRK